MIGPPTSLDVLNSLVSKSLLRLIETNTAARLVMLETLREFGWEQLTQSAELEVFRRAHAAYYVSLAEATEWQLAGIDQKVWLWRLEVEQDNLRAALRWGIEYHEGEWAQRMAGARNRSGLPAVTEARAAVGWKNHLRGLGRHAASGRARQGALRGGRVGSLLATLQSAIFATKA